MDDTKIGFATQEVLARMMNNGTRASASNTAPTPPSSSGAVHTTPSLPPLNPQLGGPQQPPNPPAGSSGGGNGSSNQGKGNILKKISFDFNNLMAVLCLLGGIWAINYKLPETNAYVQVKGLEKSKAETEAVTRQVEAEQKTAQMKEAVKIAKLTGKAPTDFTVSLPAPQQPQAPEMQAPSQVIAQQESNQYPHGVITVPLGQRISLGEGLPFSFDSNANAPSATIMSRHTIKSIGGGGEYMLVHMETGEKTSWSTASGQIPTEVKSFLEAHRMTMGHPESMELYTRNGKVIFQL